MVKNWQEIYYLKNKQPWKTDLFFILAFVSFQDKRIFPQFGMFASLGKKKKKKELESKFPSLW